MTYKPGGINYFYSTTTPLAGAGSVQSGILDLQGFQFLETELYADVNGTLLGEWFDDENGTNLIRTFTLPYSATVGLSKTSTTVLGRYLRYTYTNGADAQSYFKLGLNLTNTPYSGQMLQLDQFVPPNILSLVTRSIATGSQPDGDYVNAKADGSAFSTSTALGGTMLNGAINDTVTTITVDSTADFPSSGTIRINDEIITYTGKTSTTFTGCTRGAEQTTAASHVDNNDVGECYVSDWFDTDGWNSIELFIAADQASQFLGVQFQFTNDANATTPTVRGTKNYSFTPDDIAREYDDIRERTILDGFRVIYANGSTTQTMFFLDAVLRINQDSTRYNKSGAVLVEDFETNVALGLVSNYEVSTKFGTVELTDAADNAVDIWALAGDALGNRLDTKTFPSTASVFYLASESTSDTDVDVMVDYIAADGIARSVTVTLTGQTGVSIGFSALDVNRMEVVSSQINRGNVYCATSNSFTSGVPSTLSQTVAYIPAEYGQTQQTHFTVPAKKRMIIKGFDLEISRASGAAGSGIATLRIKKNGAASIIKRRFFPTTGGPIKKDKSNIVVEPLSQVVWRLDDVSDNDTNCSCIWDYELIDD